MLATLDLSSLAPGFANAVGSVHAALQPVAFVVVVGGLTMLAIQAFREQATRSIGTGLVRILAIALLVSKLSTLGNMIVDAVNDVGSAIGFGNGNVFAMYTAAIKQKFGIDLSQLNQIVPNGPFGSATSSSGTLLTHYAYPGDSTPDPYSGNGIGNHDNQLVAYQMLGQVASAALTTSAASYYGVSLGQTFSVTSGSGTIYNLRYEDTAPESDMRVDIYDPNGLLPGGNNFSDSVTSEANGPAATQDSGIGGFVNAMIHPGEAMGSMFFGLVVLFLSYVALFIMWLVALIQAILFNALWALSPLFLGFLMVRPLENIGKAFLLSFFAVCIWPLAFIVAGIITQLLIGLAVNSGNNAALGASNLMGMQYFWMIGLALWVIISSIFGPWIVSKRFLAGAVGLTELAGVAGTAAIMAVRRSASAAIGGVKGLSGISGPNGSSPLPVPQRNLAPNYARRPDPAQKES